MFCKNCGTQIDDNVKFCPNCGESVADTQPQQSPINAVNNSSDNSKLFNILSYIGILWLIGLLVKPEKNMPNVKFHVGQGIILSITSAVLNIVASILNSVFSAIFTTSYTVFGYTYSTGTSTLGLLLIGLVWLAASGLSIALMVIGIVNAAKGNEKQLPVVGKYAFYK